MAHLSHSLNYQPHFDQYAQQILEKNKIQQEFTTNAPMKISNFLQEIGASFINSIQLQNFQKTLPTKRNTGAGAIDTNSTTAQLLNINSTIFDTLKSSNTTADLEYDYIPNQIIIDSSTFDSMDDLHKQLEYDKFMNEVWIGIVLTLILISMIFCICSCFLYHQFRTWKRNYHTTTVRANSHDIEALKTENESLDDPVPEYTLVSGLPSYEAALELMQKSPQQSCLIVYPSVFNIFNKNEKVTTNAATTTTTNSDTTTTTNQQNIVDSTTPLLTTPTTTTATSTPNSPMTTNFKTVKSNASLPTYDDIMMHNHNQIFNSTNLNVDFNNCCTTTNMNEKELLKLLNEQTATTNMASDSDEKPLEEVFIHKSQK